jgi:hypothetical protein
MNSITPLTQKQNGDGTYYINNITNNIIQMDKQKSRDILERTETKHLSIAQEIKTEENSAEVAAIAAEKKEATREQVVDKNQPHQH